MSPMGLLTSRTIELCILLWFCTLQVLAQPVPQLLAADSLGIFTDNPSHYPQLHDALHSLCRQLAEEKRWYEMDEIYRTREMRQLVVGRRLDAVCGELPRLIRRPTTIHAGSGGVKVLVGTGSP